jgi:pumilio family protein 6
MCDVMDDTVLVNKMLLAELHSNPDSKGMEDDNNDGEEKPSPILDLVLSNTGSKLFLLLLVSKEEESSTPSDKATPRWQKYLDPYELSVLHRNPTLTENGEEVATSKKEDETRRRELVTYLKELLIEVCVKHTEDLMSCRPGSRVLMEVCESFPSEEVFRAIVEACAKGEAAESLPMLEHPIGHLTLKHIFLSESKKEVDEDDPSLARLFYSEFGNKLGDIASSNRGAFVLSALIQTCVKEEVKRDLKRSRCLEKGLAGQLALSKYLD